MVSQGLEHSLRPACAIVITDDRRGTFGNGMDSRIDDLSDTRYDRHHGDIQIASGDRKYIVAADRHQTVGKLHDKPAVPEADNIFARLPQSRISSPDRRRTFNSVFFRRK